MKTMTVKELIKELRRHPDHTPVYLTVAENSPVRHIESIKYLRRFEAVVITLGEHVMEGTRVPYND